MHLRILRFSYKRNRFILFLLLMVFYILIPGLAAATHRVFGLERCIETISYASHTLIPLCSVLLGLVYLQMWIDNDCQETMRACSRGRFTSGIGILILTAILVLMLLPLILVAMKTLDYSFGEFIKLSAEIFFCLTMLYALSLLFRSMAVGIIVVIAYLMFCILFSGNADFVGFCIVRVGAVASLGDAFELYLPVTVVSAFVLASAILFERYVYRKY